MAEKIFCRTRKDRGVYTSNFGEKVITLTDRELFKTEDPELIRFLKTDPEIELYMTESDADSEEAANNVRIKRR